MTTTDGLRKIRADLIRESIAHEGRSSAAVAALPPGRQDAPEWLMDA